MSLILVHILNWKHLFEICFRLLRRNNKQQTKNFWQTFDVIIDISEFDVVKDSDNVLTLHFQDQMIQMQWVCNCDPLSKDQYKGRCQQQPWIRTATLNYHKNEMNSHHYFLISSKAGYLVHSKFSPFECKIDPSTF